MISFFKKKPGTKTQSKDKPGKLAKSLRKTRDILTTDIAYLLQGKKHIDDNTLEELENRLIMADVGLEATEIIIERLSKELSYGHIADLNSLLEHLANLLSELLRCEQTFSLDQTSSTTSILLVGVNGSGKTTSIGKLANLFKAQGYSVMLAAGDTFRAAAVAQLQTWGERNNVPVVAQQQGADPASVIYDALQSAQSKKIDVLLADTAGRLHTHDNLMEELKKIKRVMQKIDANAPNETWLVIDASIGQNALQQAKQFHNAIGLSGIILSKLDGTAKGGIVFAIKQQLDLPIHFIGIGEQQDDLHPFNAEDFIDALLQAD